ncbi:hypothetical protein DMH01_15070 [Amycolatopsis sp. WAC 04182]|uniref:hypothetical protein n=1 Tax=Amycolatopsis sp. WAC 04182 TaxID=2203198 RepID=UPI000F76B2B9|nr:hypothetical protein [Amycolatopsis sp. WAC 04182]RSN60618.1 hypothetical protein DMH01_15070 [Amycolatopsis sp. WAC 04182]
MPDLTVTSAQSPAADTSDDRIFTTHSAVIVLDGASAYAPVPVSPSTYADSLGRHLRDHLAHDTGIDLADALADAITATTIQLGLTAGRSPSSTVTILRRRDEHVDVLMLGDNLLVAPGRTITDPRLDHLDIPERHLYKQRLADGTGFDDTHRGLLITLQRRQAARRNRPGGYWIAETDPAAAYQAIRATIPADQIPWAIVATDGAYTPMKHLGITDWPTISAMTTADLHDVVTRCHTWEHDTDPDARTLPRAKRHDDKTLAAVRIQLPAAATDIPTPS